MREKRVRDLDRKPPAQKPNISLCRESSPPSAPGQRHECLPPLNLSQLTFAPGSLNGPEPALRDAQGDPQRPRPRPRLARPFPIHSVRSLAQPFREHPASAPLCGPPEGWAREWQCPDTKRGMEPDGEPDSLRHPRAPTSPRPLLVG